MGTEKHDYSSTGETPARGFEDAGEEMEAANRRRRGHNPEKRSVDFTDLPDSKRHIDAGDAAGMVPSESGSRSGNR
ncbi:MAG TPA: hypothetical protein VHZ99_12845 [Steroidobacteraceae bacterium]|jgi:hypothetical protein|nr:hypothetical protein [Steroidobacteraceae bacterium]